MRNYKTLDRLHPLTGALRALDLLGQLPLRDPAIPASDALHDALAIADDWNAVGEDLWASYRTVLDDRSIAEALDCLQQQEAEEARKELQDIRLFCDELREAVRAALSSESTLEPQYRPREETDDQMELFEPERAKAG